MTSPLAATLIPPSSWNPNITPYRLLFFATNGGLGIAKVVLVSKGETASSTTVEWITGVVVALIMQFLGSCEYSDTRPRCWDWLFCYNLIEYSARVTGEPYFDSDNVEHTRSINEARMERPPLVTAYRLLVSGFITAFGLAKMTCGYLGFSSAMNTLDWTIAVPLTLGLYYLGLYEENKTREPRKFFDVEYSQQTKLVFKNAFVLTAYLWGTVTSISWIALFLYILRTGDYTWVPIAPRSAWDVILERLATCAMVTGYLFAIQMGAVGLGWMLWPIIESYGRRRANLILHYTTLVIMFTLYATLLVTLIIVFGESLSSCVEAYRKLFKPTSGGVLWILWRIIRPLVETGWTAFLSVILLLFPYIFFLIVRQSQLEWNSRKSPSDIIAHSS